MRKNYQMWLLGALVGGLVLPFAGCSNEDDPISNGPGSGETFETELSIALSSGSGASTKASDDEVQANGDVFNGITGINLLSYQKTGISASDYAPTGSENVLTTRFLADIPATTTFKTEEGSGSANYVTYRQSLALNKASQGFLFYGQSAYTPAAGKINATISAANAPLSETTFDLVNLTPTEDYKTQMEEYLKAVYTALYNYNPDYVVAPAGGHSDDDAVQSIYSSLNSAKSGSFVQIADLMAQLYVLAENNLLTPGASSSGSLEAIKTAINSSIIFQLAPSSTGSTTVDDVLDNMSYTPVTDGLATILGDNGILAAYYELSFCEHSSDGSGDFLTPSTTNTYTSPAALYYYVNTYPVDYSAGIFENLTWGGGTTSGLIDTYQFVDLGTSSPTKIALAHSVQYGVGRLDVTLNFNTNLDDNDGDTYTKISSSDLTLKGVLIGNQKQVGWDFLPTASATDKVIYDNEVEAAAAKVLALPTGKNEVVNIALELEYNDVDGNKPFIGANGQKIPSGSTFYVVGKLDPTDTDAVKDNPDGLQAVFVSDYTTKATLTLNSVKTAQNTVPDLSGTNLEFALSVNLAWNSGITFDVTIP